MIRRITSKEIETKNVVDIDVEPFEENMMPLLHSTRNISMRIFDNEISIFSIKDLSDYQFSNEHLEIERFVLDLELKDRLLAFLKDHGVEMEMIDEFNYRYPPIRTIKRGERLRSLNQL
jgi:hypothetical protein